MSDGHTSQCLWGVFVFNYSNVDIFTVNQLGKLVQSNPHSCPAPKQTSGKNATVVAS